MPGDRHVCKVLSAPFPWFGGKSRAAGEVWAALGDVANYVEPFGGSAAVMLARPHRARVETYNDADGLLVNFWRAIRADPEAVATAADWPVSEADLHARHYAIVVARADVSARVCADPDWYDAKLAGWWVWGACCWIGSGWASGAGPWWSDGEQLIKGNAGQGIHRQLPHVGNAGRGIHRKLPHVGDAGRGAAILVWFSEIAARLERVRITCGDWARVTTPSVCERHGITGVLLDPPYPIGWDTRTAYAGQDGEAADICADVFKRSVELSDRGVRVVVCGYSGVWIPPDGWTERPWSARKGYAADGGARQRTEVLWCSPQCVPVAELGLFGGGSVR